MLGDGSRPPAKPRRHVLAKVYTGKVAIPGAQVAGFLKAKAEAGVLCGSTDVTTVEERTRGMVNTHSRAWYKRKGWGSATPNDLRVALKKWFECVALEKGLGNSGPRRFGPLPPTRSGTTWWTCSPVGTVGTSTSWRSTRARPPMP